MGDVWFTCYDDMAVKDRLNSKTSWQDGTKCTEFEASLPKLQITKATACAAAWSTDGMDLEAAIGTHHQRHCLPWVASTVLAKFITTVTTAVSCLTSRVASSDSMRSAKPMYDAEDMVWCDGVIAAA